MPASGLYIHIPFCKSRCIYCDFYSTTYAQRQQDEFVKALTGEMNLRKGYLPTSLLDSLYIGGGTPSVLSPTNLQNILKAATSVFELRPNAEVTIEVNPDDVTKEFAHFLAESPVNRVSMGVQTFDNNLLKLLHRRHNAKQVEEAIDYLQLAGIGNISIDLIYGLPGQTLTQWHEDINKAFSLPTSHLSSYALIYEEGTLLYKMREKDKVTEADEELSLQMYENLMNKARIAGFNHYEISNFAKPGHEAHHNSGYWNGMLYLGLGPGAHSYDGMSRQWNKADLLSYINASGDVVGSHLFEKETLDTHTRQEETILTQLRTAGGIDLSAFAVIYGQDKLQGLLLRAKKYLDNDQLTLVNNKPASFINRTEPFSNEFGCLTNKLSPFIKEQSQEEGVSGSYLCLTRKGLFVSDDIISSLFED